MSTAYFTDHVAIAFATVELDEFAHPTFVRGFIDLGPCPCDRCRDAQRIAPLAIPS